MVKIKDQLNLLGMDRMIRRAYEQATAGVDLNKVQAWHEAEVKAKAKALRKDLYGTQTSRV